MSRARLAASQGRLNLPPLGRACAGELVGTYLLAFFGCGSVMSTVITGAQVGLWQVAVVWTFPDPSRVVGTEDEQLAVYREVRDAIRTRIEEELIREP